jgi:DNA sulfur modification protein DndB
VALDEDDAAAIVTRWIATRYDGLRVSSADADGSLPHLVQLGTRDEIPPTNQRSITTIVSLYRMTKGIFQKDITALNKKYQGNRPDDEELEAIYAEAEMVWDLMRERDEALGNVLGSDPAEQLAAVHRNDQGGHILFRPMGLQSFGRALGLLRTRKVETKRAVEALCSLPMSLAESPWVNVVWNPNTRRMNNDSQSVAEALFLHMVGHEPRSKRLNLAKRYRELLGLPEEDDPIKDVPVYGLR